MAESLTTDQKPADAKGDEKLLVEIRERFDLAQNFWREIRAQGAIDMRYVAGDPWEAKDRKARIDAGRPCLSLDELGQYFNQVINDVRANPRSVKFSPTGNGANDEYARFYQDKMREIEYRSHAQIAYTTAFQNTVERSYGWVRLNTKHQPKSFDQELWIEDIPNPDLILSDPEAKKPDSSDMKYLFHFEMWDVKEFRRRFPKARVTDFSEFATSHASWVKDGGEKIVLAEYWTIQTTTRTLLRIAAPDPSLAPADFYEDELAQMPPGGLVLAKREEEMPKVRQYLTNGVEILERSEWAGEFIPFASCFGKRIYVDSGSGPKLQILSMTRLARDPYMLYCYYRTAEAEVVGRVPKIPAVGYEGQFRGHETDWQESIHQPKAFLEVKAQTEATGPTVLPLPQMQTWEPPIQALEIGAESARRAIQSAMGTTFLPTQAQRRNEKSGKALQQIEQTAQKGSYHFLDSYDTMIRHVGVMVEDLMDKIYDSARDVGIRHNDETAEVVRINDPNAKKPVSTKGDYLVTVSTGPSFESEREAASDFADNLANNPQIFGLIGDLVVKLKNLGPIGDKISERLKAMLPPQILQAESKDGEDTATLKGQLMALSKELEAVKAMAQEQHEQIQTDAVKGQRDVELAQAKEEGETARTEAKLAADRERVDKDNATKIELERIRVAGELLKTRATLEAKQTEAMIDAALREVDAEIALAGQREEREAVSQEADKDRQFQREEGDVARAHEADQAERGRQAETEQNEASE